MTHTCNPGEWCRLCDHNAKFAGTRPATFVPPRGPLPTVCPHLDPTPVRVPGSVRLWRRCTAGHGSTAHGAEGLVCGCATPAAGVWRQGVECGPTCPGYPGV